jgi:predicted nucleotidyltransferase component of viral defense system
LSVLKKQTEDAWNKLRTQPELQGFVLVGGSALALQIHHRESEDLDFMWPEGRLPRLRLEQLQDKVAGLEFVEETDPILLRDADDAGLDLRDFTQNYLLDGVRVSFFVPEHPERAILSRIKSDLVRVATIDEIFALKALVCAKRGKSRDWFDLYVLMKEHGYTFAKMHRALVDAGARSAYDVAASRLSACRASPKDEGFQSLVENPPTLEQLADFFTARKNAFEQDVAERAAQKKLGK